MFILSSSHLRGPLSSERCVQKGVRRLSRRRYAIRSAKVGLAVILLDTHVWVWWVSQSDRLQTRHRELLETGSDRVNPTSGALPSRSSRPVVGSDGPRFRLSLHDGGQ